MLKHRIMTALIGLPLLIGGLVKLPNIFVCGFLFTCVAISVFELCRMLYPALQKKIFPQTKDVDASKWTWFCVACACLMFVMSVMLDLQGTERGGITAIFSLAILIASLTAPNVELSIIRVCSVLISICYGCLPWLSVWDLYLMGDHARYVLLMLAIVMLGDSGAYFAGLHLGKTKLAPRFSPKKTWEGVFGGLIASIIGALIMNQIFSGSLGPWWLMALLAVVAGLVGVMGDLVESAFKRFARVKDSGTIFPGHGGFLDRVDSVLFAAPMIWLILYSYSCFSN